MNHWPSEETLYQALLDRDESFEGVFVVAVRTTGIFCRPTCSARKPLRKNVEFFPTAREALSAGYRPCQRCLPMNRCPSQSAVVRDLMERVQRDPTKRVTDEDLRAEGLNPTTVRRHFRAATGITFQAYQRAMRLGAAFTLLKKPGASTLRAASATGYESQSGFRDAFCALFGTSPENASAIATLTAAWFDTPLGPMVGVADEHCLLLLEFCDRRALEREIQVLRKQTQSRIAPGSNDPLRQIGIELREYFAGDRLTFSTPVQLVGSDFQRAVWEQLGAIPAGATRSYSEQAKAIGRPAATRAVARANGDNRLALLVPCHRVIGADGDLRGYGGGLWRKRWLLDHERAMQRPNTTSSASAASAIAR